RADDPPPADPPTVTLPSEPDPAPDPSPPVSTPGRAVPGRVRPSRPTTWAVSAAARAPSYTRGKTYESPLPRQLRVIRSTHVRPAGANTAQSVKEKSAPAVFETPRGPARERLASAPSRRLAAQAHSSSAGSSGTELLLVAVLLLTASAGLFLVPGVV